MESFLVAEVGFEPHDLRVMSPTSYQAALLRDIYFPIHRGAGDRGRTGTILSYHGILSPGRLPVPPHRHSVRGRPTSSIRLQKIFYHIFFPLSTPFFKFALFFGFWTLLFCICSIFLSFIIAFRLFLDFFPCCDILVLSNRNNLGVSL